MRTTTLPPSFVSFSQTSYSGFQALALDGSFHFSLTVPDMSCRFGHTIQDLRDYRRHGLQKDTDVQPERALPRIRDIETDHLLECCLVLPADLPESRHTGKRVEPLGLPQSVFLRFVWNTWTRPHQTHLATKYVDQLRQLIQVTSPHDVAERNNSRITKRIQLRHRTIHCDQTAQMVLMQSTVCVNVHRAEFPHPEEFSITSNSLLLIEDGAWRCDLDYNGGQQKYRRQEYKGDQ